MIGENISTTCPPFNPKSSVIGHPRHVKIEVSEGYAYIYCCDGGSYLNDPGPFIKSKSEGRIRRPTHRCQKWCDHKNKKLAKNTQQISWLSAGIRKDSGKDLF